MCAKEKGYALLGMLLKDLLLCYLELSPQCFISKHLLLELLYEKVLWHCRWKREKLRSSEFMIRGLSSVEVRKVLDQTSNVEKLVEIS